MAEPLKAQYGPEVPRRIAAMLAQADASFPAAAFVAHVLDGYDALELMPRARRIAQAMARFLPTHYPDAVRIVLASLGPPAAGVTGQGMAAFLYLPHTLWLAEQGLEHPAVSTDAMHAITQRFSGEFGIRPFLDRWPDAMLPVLARWCDDPSPLVRRLVSEGTRPRLPWASRLQVFGRDPSTVEPLLARLRDDPDDAVRRSVANHLNDIGHDDPVRLLRICTEWRVDAPPARQRLLRHALRTRVKRGDPAALALLGYGGRARVALESAAISPARPVIGAHVEVDAVLRSTARRTQPVLVDLRIGYARAPGRDDGSARTRVFKLVAVDLAPGATLPLHKRLSLRQMTTRTHHPGRHTVDLLVNGTVLPLGTFVLRAH